MLYLQAFSKGCPVMWSVKISGSLKMSVGKASTADE